MGQRGRRTKKAPIDITKIDPSKYELFNKNIYIAYEIAKRYYPKPLLFEDAIQIAQEGLWKACLNFDESRGFAFSTLAYRTISNTLIKFASKESQQERDCYISLDAEIKSNTGESTNLENLLINENSDSISKLFENTDAEELMDVINDILDTKTEEERKLFEYLKDGRSNDEIKEDLGITRNRISKFRKELLEDLLDFGYLSDEQAQEMK